MKKHIFICDDAARLRSYSGTSRGGKTVLKLELEIGDPFHLGDILRQCADFNTPEPRRGKAAQQRLLPPPGGVDAP